MTKPSCMRCSDNETSNSLRHQLESFQDSVRQKRAPRALPSPPANSSDERCAAFPAAPSNQTCNPQTRLSRSTSGATRAASRWP